MNHSTIESAAAGLVSLLLASALCAQTVPPGLGQLAGEDRFACEAGRIYQGAATNDHMGHAMAAGNWNDDSMDDLLVAGLATELGPCEFRVPPITGALQPVGTLHPVGNVWLIGGAPASPSPPPVLIHFTNVYVVDEQAPAISFIGDIDGDGCEEIAIGMPGLTVSGDGVNTGAVYIYLSAVLKNAVPGSIVDVGASTPAPDIVIPAPLNQSLSAQPFFGASVAAGGDVNGDTYPDLVIGAPGNPMASFSSSVFCPDDPPPPLPPPPPFVEPQTVLDPPPPGVAFIYIAQPGTPPSYSLWARLDGGARSISRDHFGASVAGVGDVDGDGFDDVLVGAPEGAIIEKLNYNTYGSGYASLFRGQAAPPVGASMVGSIVEPGLGHSLFGFSVAGAIDIVASTPPRSEILIGAPLYSSENNQGAVFAYRWDPLISELVPALDDLQPITLPTEAVLGPPPQAAAQDEEGRLGWAIATIDAVAFEGQYEANPGPLASPEFLVSALLAMNDDIAVTQCGVVSHGGRQSGRVFVLSIVPADPAVPGAESQVVIQAAFFGEEFRSRLGTSLAVGDFNGDQKPDAAAGASGYAGSGPETEIGRVYIFDNGTQ